MAPHKHHAPSDVLNTTPVAVEKSKTIDSNRQPNVHDVPNAETKRGFMLLDSSFTTILMRHAQYKTDVLYDAAADFDTVFPKDLVAAIQWEFKLQFSKQREKNKTLNEKGYSAAWVSNVSSTCAYTSEQNFPSSSRSTNNTSYSAAISCISRKTTTSRPTRTSTRSTGPSSRKLTATISKRRCLTGLINNTS